MESKVEDKIEEMLHGKKEDKEGNKE